MIFHYVDSGQLEKELSIHREMLEKFSDDSGVLNSYAWRMAELGINLEDALVKVQKAIVLTINDPSQANIIDTEAEIYWKLKRFDDAINSIDRALSIDPDNQYFRDQKEKFLESKNQQKLQSA
jgi:tetratricopeptide (TPR) repeat protein